MTEKAKILVVDDERDLVEIISSRLNVAGYEVITAYGGRAALEMALDEIPDLIILDIIMPITDGFEVLRRLRDNPKTTHIPVIMFTKKSETKDIFKAQELRSTDYIIKPFSLEKLLKLVDKYLRLSE